MWSTTRKKLGKNLKNKVNAITIFTDNQSENIHFLEQM